MLEGLLIGAGVAQLGVALASLAFPRLLNWLTIGWLALPLPLLFHQHFLEQVILPIARHS